MTDYYLHGFTKLAAGNSKDFALAGNISELTSLWMKIQNICLKLQMVHWVGSTVLGYS